MHKDSILNVDVCKIRHTHTLLLRLLLLRRRRLAQLGHVKPTSGSMSNGGAPTRKSSATCWPNGTMLTGSAHNADTRKANASTFDTEVIFVQIVFGVGSWKHDSHIYVHTCTAYHHPFATLFRRLFGSTHSN